MTMGARTQPERANHDDARTTWLDMIAAVDYLAKGPRWELTIWEAIEEAVRWWILDYVDRDGLPVTNTASWDDPDPLRTAVGMTLAELPSAGIPDGWLLADALQIALSAWTRQMADLYNNGHHWPAPTSPRTIPAGPIDPDHHHPHDPLYDNHTAPPPANP